MRSVLTFASLLTVAVPVTAQTSPTAPSAPATGTAATELTPDEQKLLARCEKMSPGQAGQSSKCSKVMVKAGKGDPSKARARQSSGI